MVITMDNFDFHDAEIITFQRSRDQAVLTLKLWDEQYILLVFYDVFMSREIDCIGGLLSTIEATDNSEFLNNALTIMSDLECSKGELSKMKHFSLISTDDVKIVEIIGSSVSVDQISEPIFLNQQAP